MRGVGRRNCLCIYKQLTGVHFFAKINLFKNGRKEREIYSSEVSLQKKQDVFCVALFGECSLW